MARIIKSAERDFKENPNKIDGYRLFTDISRVQHKINPQYLQFDIRLLPPGQYSAPYHSHRFAEELFMIISGSATLRSPGGFEVVDPGDLLFFEVGDAGAHQLYNHTGEPCTYLDIRTYIGYDVCDYPDSDKVLLAPSFEIFDKNATLNYFYGEDHVGEIWKEYSQNREKKAE